MQTSKSAADLGFPRRGGNLKRGGVVNLLFGQILLKLHTNWTESVGVEGGGRPKFYYVDIPLQISFTFFFTLKFSFKNCTLFNFLNKRNIIFTVEVKLF